MNPRFFDAADVQNDRPKDVDLIGMIDPGDHVRLAGVPEDSPYTSLKELVDADLLNPDHIGLLTIEVTKTSDGTVTGIVTDEIPLGHLEGILSPGQELTVPVSKIFGFYDEGDAAMTRVAALVAHLAAGGEGSCGGAFEVQDITTPGSLHIRGLTAAEGACGEGSCGGDITV